MPEPEMVTQTVTYADHSDPFHADGRALLYRLTS